MGATVAYLFRYFIEHEHPGRLLEALTKTIDGGGRSSPGAGAPGRGLASLTLAQISGRRLWQLAAIVSLGSVSVFGLLSGRVTALSQVVSLLLGWASAGRSLRPRRRQHAAARHGGRRRAARRWYAGRPA